MNTDNAPAQPSRRHSEAPAAALLCVGIALLAASATNPALLMVAAPLLAVSMIWLVRSARRQRHLH